MLKAAYRQPPYITYLDEDDIPETVKFDLSTSIDEVFYRASQLVIFDDCYPVRNVLVHLDGETYHYAGWQPGMLIEFEDEHGKTFWSASFPQFDH